MCLIAWNWQPGSDCPLLLVANRDEFYARPSAALHAWSDAPIVAGRDLQAGGTWLGVTHSGRMAALTNYRQPSMMRSDAPSRGELVSGFLQGDASAADYLGQIKPRAGQYNPFNLLVFDCTRLMGLQSRDASVLSLAPGVGAVSNADFHTPWPKLGQLTRGLKSLLAQGPATDEQLLDLLQDRNLAADGDLPDTGIPLALERVLSASFIATQDYGTRACSVLRYAIDQIDFSEHSFDAQGATGSVTLRLPLVKLKI
ncbi:MAG: NRDE family protein [Rhodoferax sp.]|jgi:uncharacterized protein with NRDE domain|uniref:NRDE family protein n=1 Tax=Rhodoferax sp. TaxID=50421 RepID=UPI001B438088|nr:NRDE family protein [Rhodoferax sp.]MBP9148069.1 NRDE family protein [Rhodoferax sp.]MBP9737671.1 NRDE family protein [Rhodoferax sp.]